MFLILWLVFHDDLSGELKYSVPAISAATVLLTGFVFREVILQRARNKAIKDQKRLDRNLSLNFRRNPQNDHEKLTLQQHEDLVAEIRKKSEAARILGHLPEGHKEVSDLSEKYLNRVAEELPKVLPGSPRLAVFTKGQKKIRDLHRFHMLRWAEIVTRSLIQEAKGYDIISERLSTARKAQDILDHAVGYYPAERDLLESKDLLNEFIVSIEIAEIIEHARNAESSGDRLSSIEAFKEALSRLEQSNMSKSDITLLSEEIETELKKIENNMREEDV